MNSKLLLRIAALLILIHTLGHCMGHLSWDEPEDAMMRTVVDKMKSYSAPFMGATKTMADYYNGYSLMIFGLFGSSMLILWSASGCIREHAPIVKKFLIPLGLAYVYFGVVEYIFFFPFAAAMSFLAGVAVLIAAVRPR